MRKVMTPSKDITTTNLTLAAYLMLIGHQGSPGVTDQRTPNGHPVGCWKFDASVQDDIERFSEGEAKVDPIAFHRALTIARRDMIGFLEE